MVVGEGGASFPRVVVNDPTSVGLGGEMLRALFDKWEAEVDFWLLLCVRMRPFSADTHLAWAGIRLLPFSALLFNQLLCAGSGCRGLWKFLAGLAESRWRLVAPYPILM